MTDHFMDSNPIDDIPGRCGRGTVRVIINNIDSGCHGIPSNYQDQVDTSGKYPVLRGDAIDLMPILYGPLGEGEYYETGDINGDGLNEIYKATTLDDGTEQILIVYGYDDEGNKTETPYNDWLEQQGPDLSELIAEYGEDVVNDAKAKYDELVDFIGNVPEDPVGSIKKIIDIYMEGVAGVPSECSDGVAGGPLDEWYKKCVTVGVLIEIGIPGLPGGLGGIFKGATIGEIEEALKKIGKKFEDIVNGTPTCGEDGKQECTPENILGDLAREVIDSIGSIFEDAEGNITVESVLGKLGGIFGSVLGGIIYDQFKDLINEEIENVIGVPVIPFAPLQECEDKGLETIETSPGQYECGECKQRGFTPTGPKGECVDPNAVDPFDETKCVEEDYFNENKIDCEAAGYVNCAGGENSQAQETTGGIIKGTLDDCDVIQDPQCIGDGRWDGEKCVCPDGTDKAGEEEPLDGNCSDEEGPDDVTPTGPDGIKCEDGYPERTISFLLQDQQQWWRENCSETHCTDGSLIPENGQCPDDSEPPNNQTCDNNAVNAPDCNQCENGESPDAHVDSDCSKPLKEVGTNPGDACDLAEAGYSSGGVGVIDANGDCKKVGQKCNRQSYGFGPSDNCSTGLGFNTAQGVIDSNGNCVCNEVCDDPNRKVIPSTGACSDSCKEGWKEDAEGNCTVKDTGVDECTDPNRNQNDDGSCGENCNAGFDQPAGYDVCTSIQQLCADGAEGYGPDNELCGTDNGCPEGQKKFDGENCDSPCPTNPDIGANSLDCVAPQCDNDATNYPDCNQCPKGKILNDQGVCVTTDVASCDEQNRVTNDDGTCGECKAGYTFDTNQDLCVADGGEDECANGATDFPACTTCPEGSVMNEDGLCVSVTTPPETGGGGGGGGGMMGSFTPFLAGISYTPQAVPEPPAPAQKDYMAELDNIIKRSLFEGMA